MQGRRSFSSSISISSSVSSSDLITLSFGNTLSSCLETPIFEEDEAFPSKGRDSRFSSRFFNVIGRSSFLDGTNLSILILSGPGGAVFFTSGTILGSLNLILSTFGSLMFGIVMKLYLSCCSCTALGASLPSASTLLSFFSLMQLMAILPFLFHDIRVASDGFSGANITLSTLNSTFFLLLSITRPRFRMLFNVCRASFSRLGGLFGDTFGIGILVTAGAGTSSSSSSSSEISLGLSLNTLIRWPPIAATALLFGILSIDFTFDGSNRLDDAVVPRSSCSKALSDKPSLRSSSSFCFFSNRYGFTSHSRMLLRESAWLFFQSSWLPLLLWFASRGGFFWASLAWDAVAAEWIREWLSDASSSFVQSSGDDPAALGSLSNHSDRDDDDDDDVVPSIGLFRSFVAVRAATLWLLESRCEVDRCGEMLRARDLGSTSRFRRIWSYGSSIEALRTPDKSFRSVQLSYIMHIGARCKLTNYG